MVKFDTAADINISGAEFNFEDYLSSTQEDFQRDNILIYGPKKTGKTQCALTISKFFPDYDVAGKPRAAEVMTELEDCALVAFDKSPSSTLLQYRLGLGQGRILNFARFLRLHGRDAFFIEAPKLLRRFFEDERITNVVVDTISEFNRLLALWWGQHVPQSKNNKDNTEQMWTKFADDHTEFRYMLNEALSAGGRTDRRIVYVAHARALFASASDGDRKTNQSRIQTATNRGTIIPAITGQSGEGYGQECSMILVTQATRMGARDKTSYCVMTNGNDEWEGGTRFNHILEGEETPHLRMMIEKIKGRIEHGR